MSDYLAYQAKYRDIPRDSDRELIRLVSARVPHGGRVLDVGCSTGNLLAHLGAARPDLSLAGIDKDPAAIEATLEAGFAAAEWDCTVQIPGDPLQDAVILNAVLYCLTDKQAKRTLKNVHRILKPGGHLFVWDLFHPWQQRLTIIEESPRYGWATIHIRPYSLLHELAADTGFSCEILPQYQPNLPRPSDPNDLTSWTFPPGFRVRRRISFRGGLAQPWCHAILRK